MIAIVNHLASNQLHPCIEAAHGHRHNVEQILARVAETIEHVELVRSTESISGLMQLVHACREKPWLQENFYSAIAAVFIEHKASFPVITATEGQSPQMVMLHEQALQNAAALVDRSLGHVLTSQREALLTKLQQEIRAAGLYEGIAALREKLTELSTLCAENPQLAYLKPRFDQLATSFRVYKEGADELRLDLRITQIMHEQLTQVQELLNEALSPAPAQTIPPQVSIDSTLQHSEPSPLAPDASDSVVPMAELNERQAPTIPQAEASTDVDVRAVLMPNTRTLLTLFEAVRAVAEHSEASDLQDRVMKLIRDSLQTPADAKAVLLDLERIPEGVDSACKDLRTLVASQIEEVRTKELHEVFGNDCLVSEETRNRLLGVLPRDGEERDLLHKLLNSTQGSNQEEVILILLDRIEVLTNSGELQEATAQSVALVHESLSAIFERAGYNPESARSIIGKILRSLNEDVSDYKVVRALKGNVGRCLRLVADLNPNKLSAARDLDWARLSDASKSLKQKRDEAIDSLINILDSAGVPPNHLDTLEAFLAAGRRGRSIVGTTARFNQIISTFRRPLVGPSDAKNLSVRNLTPAFWIEAANMSDRLWERYIDGLGKVWKKSTQMPQDVFKGITEADLTSTASIDGLWLRWNRTKGSGPSTEHTVSVPSEPLTPEQRVARALQGDHASLSHEPQDSKLLLNMATVIIWLSDRHGTASTDGMRSNKFQGNTYGLTQAIEKLKSLGVVRTRRREKGVLDLRRTPLISEALDLSRMDQALIDKINEARREGINE